MSDVSTTFIVNEELIDMSNLANVCCYQCEFDTSCYDDSLFEQYGVEYLPLLDQAVVKRKAEFFAGRYAAHKAIRNLGVEETTVGIGKHHSPIWPDKLIGSITHNTTQAICAVAQSDNYQNIGIDLEDWIPLITANNIKADVIKASEEHIFSEIPLSFEQSLTLIFSAKESLFKALYPRVGFYFDFHAAKIIKINMDSCDFSLELTQDLNQGLVKGDVFKGKFMRQSNTVFTSIFLT